MSFGDFSTRINTRIDLTSIVSEIGNHSKTEMTRRNREMVNSFPVGRLCTQLKKALDMRVSRTAAQSLAEAFGFLTSKLLLCAGQVFLRPPGSFSNTKCALFQPHSNAIFEFQFENHMAVKVCIASKVTIMNRLFIL